jgi:hypothetical protein
MDFQVLDVRHDDGWNNFEELGGGPRKFGTIRVASDTF